MTLNSLLILLIFVAFNLTVAVVGFVLCYHFAHRDNIFIIGLCMFKSGILLVIVGLVTLIIVSIK